MVAVLRGWVGNAVLVHKPKSQSNLIEALKPKGCPNHNDIQALNPEPETLSPIPKTSQHTKPHLYMYCRYRNSSLSSTNFIFNILYGKHKKELQWHRIITIRKRHSDGDHRRTLGPRFRLVSPLPPLLGWKTGVAS